MAFFSFFKEIFLKNISQSNLTVIPQHIGIIMDGNGRWAKKIGMPRSYGHIKGVEGVRRIVTLCSEHNIKFLTLYAFSYENWNRPQDEVDLLMSLIRKHLICELEELHNKNVRIKIIGERNLLPQDILESIQNAEEKTKNNDKLTLCIAISYSSRQEILNAVKSAIQNNHSSITEEEFSEYLYSKNIPDPDLIIRTSGEQRLSNFLLWQAAYSELYFSKKFWPEFDKLDFIKALKFYQGRKRKYGRIT